MKKRNFIRRSLAWLCVLTLCVGTAGSLESGSINTEVSAADAILHSADFEGSTDGWTSFGASLVASSSAASHNGSASLFVSGRTDSWNGTACDMSSVMTAGETYQFDTWAMLNASASETIQLMAKYTDSSGDQYVSIAESSAAKGTWVQLAGELKLPSDASGVLIYFQTSGTLSDFYVDDVTVTGAASWSTAALEETPLKDIYANYFKIGCAATAAELSTVISQDVVKHHFNSLTVGNEMKPDYILDKAATQASGSNVNPVVSLEQASSVLKFCEDNQIPVRGHVLVWHSQTPEWFFRENFSDTGAFVSKAIMSQRMENYIKNVMEAIETQYPDLDLYCWDVVNECYMEDGSLRAAGTDAANGQSMWTMIYGDNSYIEEAFTYARKYAPEGCKLFYNDYNEYIEGKRDAIYNLVSDLKGKGLIDGIGMQSHLDTDYPSVDLYKQALAKFAQLGLEIQVTELDITEYDQTAANIQKQNQMYGDIMQAIVDAKKNGANITAVAFWGITDGTSWRKDGCPLLLDANYAPKQTFYEVAGLIDESEWGDGSADNTPVSVKGDVDADGDADAADVKALQSYLLAKTTTLPDAAAGDLTADGVLNGFDLAALKRMVGGGSGTDDVPALESCKLIVPVESTATIDVGTTQEVETLTLQMDTTRDYILHVNVGFWSAWCNIQCENGVLTQVDTEQNIASLTISGNTVTITFNDGVYASVDESKSSQLPYSGKITLHHNSGSYDIGVKDYSTGLGAEYVPPVDDSGTLVNMAELEGWAATAGYGRSGVTGGGDAEPVYVDTLDEITAAVAGDEPKVVVVEGTITCGSSGIEVGSNTTIVGADKNAAVKGAFYMKSVQNIIISNLTLHGFYPDSGPDDCISARDVQHLWLNHLTLHDAGDGLMDITVGSDLVTVSWCKFYYDDLSNDHRLCSLTGSGTGHDDTDMGKLNVTYHHNWFANGVDQRMPRILYGDGHVYNNYYTASGNLYCVGVGCYASVLIEGNYFKDVNRPHQFMYTHALPCYITARDNVYDNTSGAQDTGLGGGEFGTVEAFTDPPYEYTLDNAKDVPSIVSANAGPQ